MPQTADNDVVVVYVTSSQLNLYGNWTKITSENATIAIAQGTASGVLEFNGLKVGVFGVLEQGAPIESTYSVDHSTPVPYVGPSNVTTEQDGVTFYESPNLSSGNHLVVFNVTNATADNPYILEFILYIPESTTSVPGATYTSAPLPLTTGASTSSSSKTDVGAIVGGVVGGVAGLVIIGLLIFFLLLRRRRGGRAYFYHASNADDMLHHEIKTEPYPNASAPAPPPAQVPLNQVNVYSPPSSEVGGSTYSGGPSQPPMSYSASAAGSSSGAPEMSVRNNSSPNQANSKAAQAGLLSIAQQPATYHADSGIRFGAVDASSSSAGAAPPEHEIPVDVPPSYSET